MNAGVLVVSITATIAIFTVVLIAMIAINQAMIAINQLAVRLRRANRKIRLLDLWARERRADLALLVSLWFTDGDSDDLEDFEEELRKQARYVGVEWGRIPIPSPGFMHPKKLSSLELLEMLELSNEVRIPGRAS